MQLKELRGQLKKVGSDVEMQEEVIQLTPRKQLFIKK